MRETHIGSSYEVGGRWRECDRCGFDYREREFKKEDSTGLLVCPDCYDEEHPLERRENT